MEVVSRVVLTPRMQALAVTEAFFCLCLTEMQNSGKLGIDIIKWLLHFNGIILWDYLVLGSTEGSCLSLLHMP